MIFGACATTILTTPPKKVSVGGENLSLLSMRNDVDDATTETTIGKSLLESWVTTFLPD